MRLTLVRYDLMRTSAVLRSGSKSDVRVSGGRLVVSSINRWRLGSIVNCDGPSTLSTIMRMNCR